MSWTVVRRQRILIVGVAAENEQGPLPKIKVKGKMGRGLNTR